MEKQIALILQTLVANVESTIKEYIDEKITKEDKRQEINTHITVANLRIKRTIEINEPKDNDNTKTFGRVRS
jgi:carbamate kinase